MKVFKRGETGWLRSWLHFNLVLGLLFSALALALFTPLAARAATAYYVATTGSDSWNGQAAAYTNGSTGPFQTIQKCASVAVAGDTCYIRAGTYRESVTPSNSGTSSAPITFQPYNGENVTVSGANAVSGSWSVYSGSIYQTNINLPINGYSDTGFFANQIFVNGEAMIEARFPNTGSDLINMTRGTADTNSGMNADTSYGTIADSSLPSISGGLVGSLIHVWGRNMWVSHTAIVSNDWGGSVSYPMPPIPGWFCPDVCASPGSKYYLTGKLGFLDAEREWFYDGSANPPRLYIEVPGAGVPTNVEYKARTNAFDLSGKSYITVKGLNLFAATITTNPSSSNNVIDGITAKYVSHFETLPSDTSCGTYCAHRQDTGIILNGSNNTLKNSEIAYSAGNGVTVMGNNQTVTNNLIHEANYGGGYSSLITFEGGSGHNVSYNTIYNTTRDGMQLGAAITNSTIAYNNVYNYLTLSADGGGLYACCDGSFLDTTIHHNWLHDNQWSGVGNYSGAGIYLDNGTVDATAHHNVTWNTKQTGMIVGGKGSKVSVNYLYNNTFGSGQPDSLVSHTFTDASGTQIKNNIFRGNLGNWPNATFANNIYSSTDPLFINSSNNDYRLQSSSPAINYGQAISGVTDGYSGSAPDAGAYEYGQAIWVPGCKFSGCGVSAGTAQSANLALDSNFDNGQAANWWNYAATIASDGNARSGSYAARATGGSSGVGQVINGLSPNTTYVLKGWAKVTTNGESVAIGVKNCGCGDPYYLIGTTSYSQATLTFTTGASNTSAEIYFWKGSGSGTAYADDFWLTKANLLSNNNLESGSFTNWTWSYGNASVVNDGNAQNGSYAGKVVSASTGFGQVVTGLAPNTTYTLTGWAKVTNSGEGVDIGVKNYDGPNDYQHATITSTSYTQATVSFTTGPFSTSAEVYFWKNSGSGTAYGDNFSLS